MRELLGKYEYCWIQIKHGVAREIQTKNDDMLNIAVRIAKRKIM